MTRWACISIVCATALALPGGAFAAVINPPGAAGANQYSEVIPSSGGNVPPPKTGTHVGAKGAQTIAKIGQGRSGVAGLDHLGKRGRAAAALAAATAPTKLAGQRGGKRVAKGLGRQNPAGSVPTASASPPSAAGGSVASGLTDPLGGSDDGGLGAVFPLLLATILIATLGVLAGRLRRTPSS